MIKQICNQLHESAWKPTKIGHLRDITKQALDLLDVKTAEQIASDLEDQYERRIDRKELSDTLEDLLSDKEIGVKKVGKKQYYWLKRPKLQ